MRKSGEWQYGKDYDVIGTYLERIRNYLVIELISELVTRTEL